MKLDDIPFVIHDINKEMPFHTENTAKIPHNFEMGMPKNLKSFSEKVDNHFLNKHVSTIEEIAYNFPNHPLPKWMKDYQNTYFKANLRGDGYFKRIDELGYMEGTRFRQHNNSYISFLPHVNGADLTTGGDTSSSTNTWQNYVMTIKLSTGIVGQYYNQIALDVLTSAGNYRLGVYDDSSGPNNLYQQTGSIAVPVAGYTFQSLTEFALTNTSNWSSFICDNASLTFYYKSAGGNKSYKVQSYGALPNPAGSGYSTDTNAWTMKVGHS